MLCVSCFVRSLLSSGVHADDLSSMEDVVEEEVIATGTGGYPDYDDARDPRFYALPTATCAEPLSLVMERSPPAQTDAEPKLEPLRTSYSNDDENYYLEPRPPRNADSAPPSFGGT